MANKIKIFHTLKNMYEMMGIYPIQPAQSPTFNYKMFCVLLLVTLMFIGSVAYFISEANSMMEFGRTLSALLLEVSAIFYCIVNMIRMPNIVKLIENCETFIENSKSVTDTDSQF